MQQQQRFHSGMEIVLVTATTQPNNSDFAGAVDAFRSNLIAPHILALNSLTMKAFSALAREGGIYFIPDSNQVTGGLYVKSRRTWLTDTLHAIYSRTFNYRAKVTRRL